MLKYALLASAVLIATPAFAQTAPMTQQTPAAPMTTSPQTAPTDPAQAAPAQTAPTDAAQTPADQSATAAAEPAASGDQVAQAVDSQFATYDKDGNGSLSRTEFSAWMVALKAQSDPTAKATAPATKKYVAAAFAQADKDKSRSVSKGELTGFLSKG